MKLALTGAAFLLALTGMVLFPAGLFWLFGGWPCVGIFFGYLFMQFLVAGPSEEETK